MKYNKLQADKLVRETKINHQNLLDIVNSKYARGLNHVSSKRKEKRDIAKNIMPKPNKPGKIMNRLIWKYIKFFMSLNTIDEMQVEFTPLGGQDTQYLSDNTNKAAAFDYRLMNMAEIDWSTYWNVAVHGLGCQAFVGYENNCPIVKDIDPLCIIPDVNNFNGSDFRHIGFETDISIRELSTEDGFFNIEELKAGLSQEQELNKNNKVDARGYGQDFGDKDITTLYYHYDTYEGYKIMAVFGNERKTLIKLEIIEPKTKEERKDMRKIEFPFVLMRMSPINGQFFGVSFPDELLQYQDQMTILTNLEMILARSNATGGPTVVNTKYIDIKSITKPGLKFIPLNQSGVEQVDARTVASKIALDSPGTLPDNMIQRMIQGAEDSSGIGALSFGLSQSGSQTKSEIQTLQKNANNLVSYGTEMIARGKSRFWKIWYKYNLAGYEQGAIKKVIVQGNNGLSDLFEFGKKDFLLDESVFVQVRSKGQEEQKRKSMFAEQQIVYNTLIQFMTKGTYEHSSMLRKIGRGGGLTTGEIEVLIPKSPSEIKAFESLDLLNAGEEGNPYEEGDDVLTFLNVLNFAKESTNKNSLIQEYMSVYKTPAPAPQEQGNAVGNQVSGQLGNAVIQDGLNSDVSVQDI